MKPAKGPSRSPKLAALLEYGLIAAGFALAILATVMSQNREIKPAAEKEAGKPGKTSPLKSE